LKGNHALVKYALENKESILGSIWIWVVSLIYFE
jgi:hypothetical protein